MPLMEPAAEALKRAQDAGIDLSLIDCNLALSYEERVQRHQSALDLMLTLREAGIAHAESAKTAPEIRGS